MRLLTDAEIHGVAAPIPILGSIKSMTGTIRGKKNGVRAKLEVITVCEHTCKERHMQLCWLVDVEI